MNFINSNEDLMPYIPNAFREASGERTYFDKLSPWLESAEFWLILNIIGSDCVEHAKSNYLTLARKIVACMAFADAIPSLDLVLTPNGFGIVSTQNVAPASKDRVDRLHKSLIEQRDGYIDELLRLLANDNAWRTSNNGIGFVQSLFYAPSNFFLGCSYSQFVRDRRRAKVVEMEVQADVISSELFGRITGKAPHTWTLDECWIANSVRELVLLILSSKANFGEIHALEENIVNYIRQKESAFPEWFASRTASLWNMEKFQNDKNSSGYWF